MPAVGGSIPSVSLDARSFSVAADADTARKLGGFENEVQANGDGTARLLKTRVPFAINDLAISIDDARGDQEFLQELANRKVFFPISFEQPDGSVYSGEGQIVGELPKASAAATIAVSLSGNLTLEKQ